MKKRIGAVLMGVLLSTSLIGTNVFAEETEPPAESETVFEIVEGATGTYVKGSKKDHLMKVRISITAEKIHKVTVDRDDNELDRDNWSAGDSEEVPPTTEAPATSEAPAVTSEAPAVTSEAPAVTSEAPAVTSEAPAVTSEAPAVTSEAPAVTSEAPAVTSEAPAPTTDGPAPTTEAPVPTEILPDPTAPVRKVKKSSVKSYNILTPINVQAAETETKIVPVTIKGTYLETLSLGEHKVSAYILDAGVEKSVTATINVVAQETTSEAPATSEAPEATTEEEDTEDVDDNDEEDTEDESSTTKKDNTTSTKKKTSKKSKSSKTGDNSQIMLYLAIALVSGCAIVYFARKKATK